MPHGFLTPPGHFQYAAFLWHIPIPMHDNDLLGLEQEDSTMSEIEIYKMLGFWYALDVMLSEVHTFWSGIGGCTYHASRNFQSSGRRCNAR